MSAVTVDIDGGIAVVTIDNPPINASSHAVRIALADAFRALAGDRAVRGVILTAAGRTFVAGADMSEFGRPPADPALRDVCAIVEDCPVPVVCVVHGTALGGGLELALACHYRVIEPGASVGLPETTLGVIPGAGGTQRLPRLTGLAAALDLIITGRRASSDEALALGLADAAVEGERIGFARRFLEARTGRPPPRTRDRAAPADDAAAFDAARALARKRIPGQDAPLRAVEAVEAACGPFAAGLAREAEIFLALRGSEQAKALRHIFFAERTAAKFPEAEVGAARAVTRVGVVGGGTMGAGIAVAALLAGLPVSLMERDEAAADAGRGRVEGLLAEAVKRGKLSADEREVILHERFATTTDAAGLQDADLVVEAAFEDMAVKTALFADLGRSVLHGAVLATNTSYLDVAAIAAATPHPERVIGLHFFAPAHVMKLVEIVAPATASADAVATGLAFVRRLGKIAVRSGDCEGFIGNRILSAYRKAMDYVVIDGASPYDVDAAMRAYGLPMGLYAMQDLAGLDIGYATRRRLDATRDPRERYLASADRLVEAGRLGRKSGAGFYRYDADGAEPDPEVEAVVAAERARAGVTPRKFNAAEIQDRLLAAMVNEGARILDEGVALRASDIDVVMVNGYGFPRWRGGPMHAAEASGLETVLASIRSLAAADPYFWDPSPRLIAAAKSGSFG
ncbi:MAG TPA: 3-hydroxyacyl-CoA dehydrogenase NAD-binding domain-containing protein [Methylomirabilota bacterium]|nr:3-hydroxyacyl-CoA dehydrogenase NAD-binding domain-containing protein [Methylomirabilota bacterium]